MYFFKSNGVLVRQRPPIFLSQMFMSVREIAGDQHDTNEKSMVCIQAIWLVLFIKFYFFIIHKFGFIPFFEICLQFLPFYLPGHLSMISLEVVLSIISILYQPLAYPQHSPDIIIKFISFLIIHKTTKSTPFSQINSFLMVKDCRHHSFKRWLTWLPFVETLLPILTVHRTLRTGYTVK